MMCNMHSIEKFRRGRTVILCTWVFIDQAASGPYIWENPTLILKYTKYILIVYYILHNKHCT